MTAEVKDRPIYGDDFYAWTQHQATQLRAQGRLRQNGPLDWKLLTEEVRDLGKSKLHTSYVRIWWMRAEAAYPR